MTELNSSSGVYRTVYGNACEYVEGEETAYDIDMAEDISIEMVDFDDFIRELD